MSGTTTKLSFSLKTSGGKKKDLGPSGLDAAVMEGFEDMAHSAKKKEELKGLDALFSVDKKKMEEEQKEKELLVIPMTKDRDWRLLAKTKEKRDAEKGTNNPPKNSEKGSKDNSEGTSTSNISTSNDDGGNSRSSNSNGKDNDNDHDKEDSKPSKALPMTDEEKFQSDMVDRPDQPDLDTYEQVPIEEFGAALLRGMGWKKGEAIGGTFKGLAEPVEYVPRMNRLGLGAKRDLSIKPDLKRKNRGGEDKTHGVSKVGADGKVRHIKTISEEVHDEEVATMKRGAYVLLKGGPHKGHAAKVKRLFNLQAEIELALSGSILTVDEKVITPVLRAVYKQRVRDLQKYGLDSVLRQEDRSGGKRSSERDDGDGEPKHKKEKKKKHKKSSSSSNKRHQVWVCPGICVRIVSERYKRGKYYNSKVNVVDVMSKDDITCTTSSGKLLDGLCQRDLETVIPKHELDAVRIVGGEYKGLDGRMLQKNKSKQNLFVQLDTNDQVVTISFDDVCMI